LSKAMYVMSPFTSLLVLENEEMYERFHVDRGRKDHWAPYPCPPKIDVVYEPEPGQPSDRFAPRTALPRANDVRSTIITRNMPRLLSWPMGFSVSIWGKDRRAPEMDWITNGLT